MKYHNLILSSYNMLRMLFAFAFAFAFTSRDPPIPTLQLLSTSSLTHLSSLCPHPTFHLSHPSPPHHSLSPHLLALLSTSPTFHSQSIICIRCFLFLLSPLPRLEHCVIYTARKYVPPEVRSVRWVFSHHVDGCESEYC